MLLVVPEALAFRRNTCAGVRIVEGLSPALAHGSGRDTDFGLVLRSVGKLNRSPVPIAVSGHSRRGAGETAAK
jgi:hypothetical protein